ncbi:MAG: hypothetical protein CFH10_00383 [Alphaproteobacteria bacterium MarineAlpha4_Bin2]|nr:MAG: hypothetical protein CFH10_00383 [Alphaproteobacteria bacterium MarineAlpha4_Bin2]
MNATQRWVGSWTTVPAPSTAGVDFTNHTIRLFPRISIGGQTVRVRISNAHGDATLAIGGVTIALRDSGPRIVSETLKRLTFGGESETIIVPGAISYSDPVALDLPPLADIAVSIYLPGTVSAASVTGRYARQTNFISPPGDYLEYPVMPVGKITDEWFFLAGVDVLAGPETGGIVALGDSLTDGNISTHDTFSRWPDQLARRLAKHDSARTFGVMNQGLGGNRILHDIRGENGLRRFDRDVLAQPGVTHVIIMLGTNDLRNRIAKPEQEASAERMISGMHQMAIRAQAHNIKCIAATLTPFGNETFMANAWNPAREAHRIAFNEWVRTSGVPDGIVDFDAALRDPEIPTQMRRCYDCGDGLHPNDMGYCHMGDVIDLSLFD